MSTSASPRTSPTQVLTLERVLLPLILLLAMGLRLWRLGQANLWWDEALAIWAVRKGLVGVTLWTASDVHPPLYFWSLWGWVKLFGESPFAMRALSAFWGTLTVLMVYLLGKQSAGRRVGWLAALLVATSRFHIWWSQEMRMYVLAGLLGMVSLYALLRWLNLHDNASPSGSKLHPNRWLLLYALAATGSLYTIFLSGAFLVAQNILVLLALIWSPRRQRRALLWPWIVAQMFIGALIGIWMGFSWGRMPSWSTAEPVSIKLFLQMYATLITTGVSVDMHQVLPMVVLILTILALGGVALARQIATQKRPRTSILAMVGMVLTLAVSGAMIYAASLPRSLFYTPSIEARYFLPFAPALWLLLGWGLVAAIEHWRRLGWALLGILAVAWIGVLPGYYRDRCLRDDMQSLTQAIISQAQPDDAVLLDSGGRYPIFLYAYERAKPQSWHPPMEVISFSEDGLTQSQVTERLADLVAHYGRIWLAEVDVHLTDPDRLVRQALNDTWPLVWSQGFGPNALFLYASDGSAPTVASDYAADHVINQAFAGGYLRGLDMPLRRVPAGKELRIALLWDQAPTSSIALEMLNPSGTIVRHQRLPAFEQQEAQRQAFALPIDQTLSNGRYVLRLTALGQVKLLGEVRVTCSSSRPHALDLDPELGVTLGETIALDSIRILPGPAGREHFTAGSELVVDLAWRALASPSQDYKVFVQLQGEGYNARTQGPVWGQSDAQPASNSAATGRWQAGDRLVDRHIILIDEEAPEGDYDLVVGMYDAESGVRLAIKDAQGEPVGDSFTLPDVISLRGSAH